MLRICLADDHPVFIAGAEALVRREHWLTVVGTAGTGPDALDLIRRERPDIAVLDISMPGANGIEVATRLRTEQVEARIIFLSVFEDPYHVRAAMEAGAWGYVLKRSAADQLLTAIAAVSRGEVYIDPKAAVCLFANSVSPMPKNASRPEVGLLTEREREVLRATALGYTIKEMAVRFDITTKSVETYKLRAIEKLNLRSRAKIVDFAIDQGWFDQSSEPGVHGKLVTTAVLRSPSPSRS